MFFNILDDEEIKAYLYLPLALSIKPSRLYVIEETAVSFYFHNIISNLERIQHTPYSLKINGQGCGLNLQLKGIKPTALKTELPSLY